MKNKVTIDVEPVILTDTQKPKADWQLKKELAFRTLELFRNNYLHALQFEIPIKFDFEIILTLSINISSLKVKTDYSKIPCKKSARLIKIYLSGDKEAFFKATRYLV